MISGYFFEPVSDCCVLDDLRDAEIFLTSAIFFKGQWATPFNRTSTHPESFSDENDNKIGNVQMMYLFSQFAYLVKREINAVALELPYGTVRKRIISNLKF